MFSRLAPVLFAASIVVAASEVSLAASMFNVTGQFGSLNDRPLTGTLTIDTDAGVATAIDLHIGGSRPEHFALLNHGQAGQPSLGHYVVWAADPVTGDVLALDIPSLDGGKSLAGYSGGLLYSASNRRSGFSIGSLISENIWSGGSPLPIELLYGELTPLAVPEPSTVALAAVGLLALAGVAVRRTKRSAVQE